MYFTAIRTDKFKVMQNQKTNFPSKILVHEVITIAEIGWRIMWHLLKKHFLTSLAIIIWRNCKSYSNTFFMLIAENILSSKHLSGSCELNKSSCHQGLVNCLHRFSILKSYFLIAVFIFSSNIFYASNKYHLSWEFDFGVIEVSIHRHFRDPVKHL